jgi:hypothetical protein
LRVLTPLLTFTDSTAASSCPLLKQKNNNRNMSKYNYERKMKVPFTLPVLAGWEFKKPFL